SVDVRDVTQEGAYALPRGRGNDRYAGDHSLNSFQHEGTKNTKTVSWIISIARAPMESMTPAMPSCRSSPRLRFRFPSCLRVEALYSRQAYAASFPVTFLSAAAALSAFWKSASVNP